jgi:hypothetical protein
MPVARDHTFVDGEILTAALLEAEFDQIIDNQDDLGWPATKTKAMAGKVLDLDLDADTSISAASDDIIIFEINGQALFTLDGAANGTTVNGFKMTMNDANGDSALAAGTLAAIGSDTDIDFRVDPKGAGVFNISGVNAVLDQQSVLAQWFFAG